MNRVNLVLAIRLAVATFVQHHHSSHHRSTISIVFRRSMALSDYDDANVHDDHRRLNHHSIVLYKNKI